MTASERGRCSISRSWPPLLFGQASFACVIFGQELPESLAAALWLSARESIPGKAQPQRNRTETEELKPLALTGGIACGKTTAGQFLLEAGFSHVYDTDAICHDLYDHPTPELLDGMQTYWGGDIVASGPRIDRAALSRRLFSAADREDAFAKLNALVHPAVEQRLRELMDRDSVREDELVLVEVPLLFEIGWESRYAYSIAVWMPREMQIMRLMTRDGMTREAAESRLSVQISGDAKLARADFGLINNGGLEHLRRQCFALTAHLKSLLP